MRSLYLFGFLLILACNQESLSELDKLYKEYELQPNAEHANAYLTESSKYIKDNIGDFSLVKKDLHRSAKVALDNKMFGRSLSYLTSVLKHEGLSDGNTEVAEQIGDILMNIRKKHAARITYLALSEQYPNKKKDFLSKMDTTLSNSEEYLQYLFDQVLVNPNELGINNTSSLKYVDAVEAYALIKQGSENTPKHLYQASEVARSLRTIPKAMTLYDWLLDRYPNYEKTPTVMFVKAFLLEQEFKRSDEAKELYQNFLVKYPNHEMASSAQFLLDNMGKSDEEILQKIEGK